MQAVNDEALIKPPKGTSLPLDQVDDSVFSSGAKGQGVAVDPIEGILVAPADGEMRLLADTLLKIDLATIKAVGKPQ